VGLPGREAHRAQTPPRSATTVPPTRPRGAWSSYWYDWFIYSSDITRGYDLLRLRDPVRAAAERLRLLNPQPQH
jgi:hypothetical protein